MRFLATIALLLLAPLALAQPTWIDLGGPGAEAGAPLVATAEGTFFRAAGDDVLRSDDGGLTWTTTAFPGSTLRTLDAAPDGWLLATAEAVYRYDGTTWTALGLDGMQPRRATSDGQGRLASLVGDPVACIVAVSTDDGATWTEHDVPAFEFGPGCVDAYVAEDGSVLVAWHTINVGPALVRLFRSTDDGATWTERSDLDLVSRFVRGQHGGLFLISARHFPQFGPWFSPKLRRYAEGTWELLASQEVTTVTTRPDGTVLVGYAYGLRTLDGETVAAVHQPRHIALGPEGRMAVSTRFSGDFTFDGTIWRQQPAPATSVHLLQAEGNDLIAGTLREAMRYTDAVWQPVWGRYRPTDRATFAGFVWHAAAGWHTGYPRPPRETVGNAERGYGYDELGLWRGEQAVPVALPVMIDGYEEECRELCIVTGLARTEDALLAGVMGRDELDIINPYFAGVFRTTDGNTWQRTLHDVPVALLSARGDTVIVAPDAYAWWIESSRALRSTDGGLTWEPVEEGLPEGTASALHLAPDGTAYLSVAGDVYRLDGNAWTAMSLGLTARDLTTSLDGRLLAATTQGLRAFDGINWVHLDAPASRALHRLAVTEDGRLAVGTDAGVFITEAPLLVSSEPDAEASRSLTLDVFPNPSAGPVAIRLTLPAEATVRVAVYDLLGRHVATLFEGRRAAGTHALTLDDRLAPGTYLVVLHAGEERHTRRIVRLGF